ncbi:MAG: cytochrome c [Calditrichaeota bacterium]|nr:cytochrome c [Calditrichota bacterium]
MNKHKLLGGLLILVVVLVTVWVIGCASNKTLVTEKSGAQLWGENCVRCHNAPSPPAFNDYQWETIAIHMRVRASLTDEEVQKIVEFLKMAN